MGIAALTLACTVSNAVIYGFEPHIKAYVSMGNLRFAQESTIITTSHENNIYSMQGDCFDIEI